MKYISALEKNAEPYGLESEVVSEFIINLMNDVSVHQAALIAATEWDIPFSLE